VSTNAGLVSSSTVGFPPTSDVSNRSLRSNFDVIEIDKKTAAPFIEKWHYSHIVPTGRNVFFGGYINEELYCVAVYGSGSNNNQHSYLARTTHKPVTEDNLMELRRLCRVGEKGTTEVPLTRFLKICHTILKREHKVSFVVSFSDPAYNHTGGIYKAANFQHLGKTNAEWRYVDEDGQIVHRRTMNHYSWRHSLTEVQMAQKLFKYEVKMPGKDRWFLEL